MSIAQDKYNQLLMDLAFTSTGAIKVDDGFHNQVKQITTLLGNDQTGLVSTILEFMVHAGTVDMNFNASNSNLNKLLESWKENVNADLNLDIPRGLRGFTEQYFRERWKSSFIVVNLKWHKVDGYWLPTRMYLMDGGSVYVKNDKRLLNGNAYYLGNPDIVDPDPLKNSENTTIIVRKPYNHWYDTYPTPYLVRKGALYHSLFKQTVLERQAEIIRTAFPYQLLIKVGTQEAIKKGIGPSQTELDSIKEQFQGKKKDFSEQVYAKGLVGAFAGDVNLEELIPDYIKALNENIQKSVDKNILYALGMIEFKGFSSNREEAMLNPKVLVEEVEDGVKDYVELMKEIMQQIRDKNSSKYTVNEKVEVQSGIIKTFLTDEMRTLIRSWYDRGLVGYQSGLENTTGLNFETQIKERELEVKNKLDTKMFPRVTQNIENNLNDTSVENVPDDKKPNTPESKNYKQALTEECIVSEMKSIRNIPNEIRESLSKEEQQIYKKAFNLCFAKCTELEYDNFLREKASLEYAMEETKSHSKELDKKSSKKKK
jgi:cation transport regulator ChaB